MLLNAIREYLTLYSGFIGFVSKALVIDSKSNFVLQFKATYENILRMKFAEAPQKALVKVGLI
jgi:hypothetical protein